MMEQLHQQVIKRVTKWHQVYNLLTHALLREVVCRLLRVFVQYLTQS